MNKTPTAITRNARDVKRPITPPLAIGSRPMSEVPMELLDDEVKQHQITKALLKTNVTKRVSALYATEMIAVITEALHAFVVAALDESTDPEYLAGAPLGIVEEMKSRAEILSAMCRPACPC